MKPIENIVIIGSGNVAYHFLNAFSANGIKVLQLLARNEQKAKELSSKFSVPYTINTEHIDKSADLYILAVQDDQIHSVAARLHLDRQLLVHTSGFSSIDLLSGASTNTGVIWPLQTLTAGNEVDYNNIPFFIEGNNKENEAKLSRIAGLVSGRVVQADSPTRQRVHLAAVIASNFTNHLYSIASSIMENTGISPDVLSPLIMETAKKAITAGPLISQTGPASRNDLNVIERHLGLLESNPEFREIYRIISNNIINLHHKK